jgi:hypothetical protein
MSLEIGKYAGSCRAKNGKAAITCSHKQMNAAETELIKGYRLNTKCPPDHELVRSPSSPPK